MTLLEYILIFAVVLLLIWQASVLLAAGRLQAEVNEQRDLNDTHLRMLSHRDRSVEVLRDECKRLEHDLEQYKDAAYEWEKLCEGHVADKKKMRMAINSIKAECDHKDLQDVLKFTKSVDAYEKKKALQ